MKSITKELSMQEGNKTVGFLIKKLYEAKIGQYSTSEGCITLTEFLKIPLDDGNVLVLRDGDYDESAEIYIERI